MAQTGRGTGTGRDHVRHDEGGLAEPWARGDAPHDGRGEHSRDIAATVGLRGRGGGGVELCSQEEQRSRQMEGAERRRQPGAYRVRAEELQGGEVQVCDVLRAGRQARRYGDRRRACEAHGEAHLLEVSR